MIRRHFLTHRALVLCCLAALWLFVPAMSFSEVSDGDFELKEQECNRDCIDAREHNKNWMDKCGVNGAGNVCNGADAGGDFWKEKCCDFADKTRDPRTCACRHYRSGPRKPDGSPCKDEKSCVCCMMIAEGSTEDPTPRDPETGKPLPDQRPTKCREAIACLMENRRGEFGKRKNGDDPKMSMCEANAQKEGSGDAASLTSDKCTCARYSRQANDPDSEGVWNDEYCNCREKMCKGQPYEHKKACDEMWDIYNNKNCGQFNPPPTHMNMSGKDPCPGNSVKLNLGCKHTFFHCKNFFKKR